MTNIPWEYTQNQDPALGEGWQIDGDLGQRALICQSGGWPSHFTRQFCCSCPGFQETPRKATLNVFHTDWSGMKWFQYIWPCSFLCEDSPNFLQILREKWFSLGLSIYPYNMWFIPIIGIIFIGYSNVHWGCIPRCLSRTPCRHKKGAAGTTSLSWQFLGGCEGVGW